MKNKITQLAFAISAMATITACGSSGGSSNNQAPTKPVGPITASNASVYIDLALTTLPSLATDINAFTKPANEMFGLPVVKDNIPRAGSQLMENEDGSSFFTRLCEDGTGQVTETALEQMPPQDTKGDFFRQDFTACTFDTFAHNGSVMNILAETQQFERMAGDADPFIESQIINEYTYDAYTVNDISSDNNIAIDGGLTIEQRDESSTTFLSPNIPVTTTFNSVKTDFYRIDVNVTDAPAIDYTFENFEVVASDTRLNINGDVTSVVGNKTYSYKVETPAALEISYTQGAADERMISAYRGNIIITSGISVLRAVLNGDSALISLDVDNDGAEDYTNTIMLNLN